MEISKIGTFLLSLFLTIIVLSITATVIGVFYDNIPLLVLGIVITVVSGHMVVHILKEKRENK
jgi:Kef-type K+ transport system membrane component KefB